MYRMYDIHVFSYIYIYIYLYFHVSNIICICRINTVLLLETAGDRGQKAVAPIGSVVKAKSKIPHPRCFDSDGYSHVVGVTIHTLSR